MAKIKPQAKFQIGKLGLTQESVLALNHLLETHNQVRISALKSSGRDKTSIKSLEQEILEKIKYPCYSRVIGFTIILSKKGSGQQQSSKK